MRRDVTVEKQANDSWHASELRFRLYASPAHEKIWDRQPQESLCVLGRLGRCRPSREDRERVLQAAQSKQASGEYVEEYRIVRPDGAIRWIRDRAFPIFRDDGAVYRIAGLAKDITERKRAEQKFKDLLESSPDAMVIVNRDGDIVLVNSQAVNLFGWRREELLTPDELTLSSIARVR